MTDGDAIIAAYDRDAGALAARYETLSADACWAPVRDLIPARAGCLALDIGAGSGRDAAWLASLGCEVVAAEPAAGMRREGMARHSTLRWIDDQLPDLTATHRLGLAFDLILLNAVWMHLPATQRARAFRKIVTLLRPGGAFLLTLRHGPAPAGRTMHPVSEGEIEALARDHGLTIVRMVRSDDPLHQQDVSWSTLALRLPDDGTVGLPLIRGIILNDSKSSTYKLGLLRSVAKVADDAASLALPLQGEDRVAIPLGLVALNWLRSYLPLVGAKLPQAPRNQGPDGLGFAGEGFRALMELGISAQDLRIGASFTDERAAAVLAAMNESWRTIIRMPVHHTTLPNSNVQLFEAEGRSIRHSGTFVLTPVLLRSMGTLTMPGPFWRTLQRLGSWIEPVLVTEWARLTRSYAERLGRQVEPGAIEARLVWLEPQRDTAMARAAASRLLAAGTPVTCVWSGAPLQSAALDIDHALPWSAWPCGDLWNLLPATRRINQHEKRDRLPSAAALARARTPILEWWKLAWQADPALSRRFSCEAGAALPLDGEVSLEAVFAGMEWRRLRISQDQQAPEWGGAVRTSGRI